MDKENAAVDVDMVPSGLLQEELRDVTKEKQLDKDILVAQQENQRLLACLQEAEEKLLKLQEKLDGYSEAKAKKAVRGKQKNPNKTLSTNNVKKKCKQMGKQSLPVSPVGEQSSSEAPGEPAEGPEGGARAPAAGL